LNEIWAIGVKGIALTSDGGEITVREAIAAATADLGPISILVWHAPPLPRAALAGLRSDPAIVVVIDDEAPDGALAHWTKDLANGGLRANALVTSAIVADPGRENLALRFLEQPWPAGLEGAIVYLASDESAAIEGSVIFSRPD
jgi:hypothetical protein